MACSSFLDRIAYVPLDASGDSGWEGLRDALGESPRVRGLLFGDVAGPVRARFAKSCRITGVSNGNSRVVLEKPIGHDLGTAVQINKLVGSVFEESNIFRIDHYLGKETVQNLLALRFANALFEPL